MAGIRWAIAQDFDVINLSLSTSKRETAAVLHGLADDAYFRRTLLVAAAHNSPVESFPWRFFVRHLRREPRRHRPVRDLLQPEPSGGVLRAWGLALRCHGAAAVRMTVTGNSFAAAFVTGLCALIRAKHRELTPFQVKAALHLLAGNVQAAHEQR